MTGSLHFETGLADYRKYFFFNPVTFAVRGLGYGRFGQDADDPRLSPLYIGQSSLVRGYDIGSIGLDECGASKTGSPNDCPVFDRLIGSRIAVASAEVRVPLFGTKEFGLLSGFIPTELVGFADTGIATNGSKQRQLLQAAGHTADQKAVSSVGIGARLLLSYIPIEVYYAKPFQRPGKGWVFGFNITPGW